MWRHRIRLPELLFCCCEKIQWRRHLIEGSLLFRDGLWPSSRELGSRQADNHSAGVGDGSLHLDLQAQAEIVNSNPVLSDTAPPTKPHVLILPKGIFQLDPSIQTYEGHSHSDHHKELGVLGNTEILGLRLCNIYTINGVLITAFCCSLLDTAVGIQKVGRGKAIYRTWKARSVLFFFFHDGWDTCYKFKRGMSEF